MSHIWVHTAYCHVPVCLCVCVCVCVRVSARVHMSFLMQLIVWSDVSKVGYLMMWSVYGSDSSLAGHQPSLDCTVFTSYPLDWYADRRECVKKRYVLCLPFTVNFTILIKWFESSNDNIIIIRSWKFESKYCFQHQVCGVIVCVVCIYKEVILTTQAYSLLIILSLVYDLFNLYLLYGLVVHY